MRILLMNQDLLFFTLTRASAHTLNPLQQKRSPRFARPKGTSSRPLGSSFRLFCSQRNGDIKSFDTNTSITDRQTQPTTGTNQGAFRHRSNYGTSVAEFDNSIQAINSYSQGSSVSSYTVRGGESLQSIALYRSCFPAPWTIRSCG